MANTYLIRYHVLRSDRFSQEKPKGLLLSQSKGLSYIAGFTMVKWLREFLQRMTDVYINPISFSIK